MRVLSCRRAYGTRIQIVGLPSQDIGWTLDDRRARRADGARTTTDASADIDLDQGADRRNKTTIVSIADQNRWVLRRRPIRSRHNRSLQPAGRTPFKAILRRAAPKDGSAPKETDAAKVLERGLLHMDPERHTCTWKNEPVTLTVTEFLILQALASRPSIISRNALMDAAIRSVLPCCFGSVASCSIDRTHLHGDTTAAPMIRQSRTESESNPAMKVSYSAPSPRERMNSRPSRKPPC